MRIVGVLAAACVAGACARGPLPEPAFFETTGSMGYVGATVCITPSAWNCYDRSSTRRDALEALEVADQARAVQKPGKAPRRWDADATRAEARASEKLELAPRPPLAEEEAALGLLRSYLACHPWDLDLTFELARRDAELNRFSDATYLFLRVAENSEDERAVSSFLRALETMNATAVRSAATECYDEMARRVPRQLARLCSLKLVAQHPERTDECTELGKIAYDIERLKAQEARR